MIFEEVVTTVAAWTNTAASANRYSVNGRRGHRVHNPARCAEGNETLPQRELCVWILKHRVDKKAIDWPLGPPGKILDWNTRSVSGPLKPFVSSKASAPLATFREGTEGRVWREGALWDLGNQNLCRPL